MRRQDPTVAPGRTFGSGHERVRQILAGHHGHVHRGQLLRRRRQRARLQIIIKLVNPTVDAGHDAGAVVPHERRARRERTHSLAGPRVERDDEAVDQSYHDALAVLRCRYCC